jgi:cell division protein FtsX
VTPPRLAWLALHLLPRALREPIAGDLEEEWRAGAHRSRWRLWNLVLRSIAACWLDRLRHGAGRRDTPRPKGDSAMQSLRQDLHYGWRLMWRNPGFTFATVATLALGIGANTAIFSVVNVLSWKALPYHEPDRVAFVLGWDLEENEMRFNLRQADYLDLQRSATTLAAVSAYSYVSANLTGGDMPDRVQAYRVTPSTFPLLGVPAALGRVFDHADAAAGRGDVAVMSHGLWQRRFGGDAAIIGRRIDVNGQPHEVIGVMPPRFDYPVFNFKGDLWLPWDLRDAERGQPGARGGATVVGRLRPGVSYAAAQAEVDVLMRGFADRYPDSNRGLGARIVEMGRLDDEQAGAAPWILLAAVGAVLLLACANVGNLLLARGIVRHRELALRAAIGASRLRIGRQLIVEGVLLGLAGGLSGLLVAVLALAGLRASLPEVLLATMPNINELGIDGAALGFTLAVSLLASLAFGALPAWRASRELFEGAQRIRLGRRQPRHPPAARGAGRLGSSARDDPAGDRRPARAKLRWPATDQSGLRPLARDDDNLVAAGVQVRRCRVTAALLRGSGRAGVGAAGRDGHGARQRAALQHLRPQRAPDHRRGAAGPAGPRAVGRAARGHRALSGDAADSPGGGPLLRAPRRRRR